MKSRFGRQSWDARSDENSMSFGLAEQVQFEQLRDAIETSLAAPVAPAASQATQTAPSADPIEQLRKLAELRDAGVISEGEFTVKKTEIMGRL